MLQVNLIAQRQTGKGDAWEKTLKMASVFHTQFSPLLPTQTVHGLLLKGKMLSSHFHLPNCTMLSLPTKPFLFFPQPPPPAWKDSLQFSPKENIL